MPITTKLWKVAHPPVPLAPSSLASEAELEKMIVEDSCLLSEDWMLIGRQERTSHGGCVDLLALAPDGSVVLIELKKDKTPREVISQALDYASWVEGLQPEDLVEIYGRFAPGRSLMEDFQERFGYSPDETELNRDHLVVVVAAELDESTERIVNYLASRGVSINVLFFQVFANGHERILSRTWLLDPIRAQAESSVAPRRGADREPWNSEYYCCFGDGPNRSWEEAVKYGFISAGGGTWYTRTLALLKEGDRVWVKVPGKGFVGVGRVVGQRRPAAEFTVVTAEGERPALDVLKKGRYYRDFKDDMEKCEYFVPVRWLQTVPVNEAKHELGMFGNKNTVCAPRAPAWRTTVERLKQMFPKYADDER